ncbi:carbon-nitrogen hydrolase family protein [Rhodoferax sp. U11-2br]|uniref:carbon-nitrogen hydrolase family protein n=1 Tax=Rhodoferax sp. U11-2br TaxID=2838878 RepID=UPI001BE5C97A|nr:carbon-nitrogen hydrolase family protein [Rhodoferax sp. U11-2br]MBT3069091.1 carbon-nitrogen hydrolase family protein [Rhodoferax sp. U11-2br]
MRITVCEIRGDDPASAQEDWTRLCQHTAKHQPDLVLLPEFAFLPAVWEQARFDQTVWNDAVAQAEQRVERLGELRCTWVLGAFPVSRSGRPLNQGFLWHREQGLVPLRCKAYLPNEAGGWEATWFDRGEAVFPAFAAGDLVFGLNICTELWALDSVCGYPAQGVQAIVTPRASGQATTERWVALAKTIAVRCGAYSLSSNRRHADGACGGVGWIIDPKGAEIARTSQAEPFVTREIDLSQSKAAQSVYPRYVFANPPRR